jgi:hypothetical protein
LSLINGHGFRAIIPDAPEADKKSKFAFLLFLRTSHHQA